MGDYLQEELQRRNNLDNGSGLCKISAGSTITMFADPSALNRDKYFGTGVTIEQKSAFSKLLASATHDKRQYTSDTYALKKSKYTKPTIRVASEP